MQMRAYESDGCLVIDLEGDIDHHGAYAVREEMDRRIIDARPKKVIMELSKVSFMDSSGLGLILGRLRTVNERGGKLYLRAPSARIVRILKMAGADRLIPVIPDKNTPGKREA